MAGREYCEYCIRSIDGKVVDRVLVWDVQRPNEECSMMRKEDVNDHLWVLNSNHLCQWTGSKGPETATNVGR